MEENKTLATTEKVTSAAPEKEKSFLDFAALYRTIILYWKWFFLSLVICVGLAVIYLRYTTPIYQASAKLLIKDAGAGGRSAFANRTLGTISTSSGTENEIEILKSRSIAEMTVRDLKLYVTYHGEGKITDFLYYKNQPVSVDLDPTHLENLPAPMQLKIERTQSGYHVTGSYYALESNKRVSGPYSIDKTLSLLPATISTRAGIITLTANSYNPMAKGVEEKVTLQSPKQAAGKYAGALSVMAGSDGTTILLLTLRDENTQRASDYLQQLAVSYNRQANEDKNEVARRTEEFINGRLEKINAELGSTEGAIESYKRKNKMLNPTSKGGNAFGQTESYSTQIVEAGTQLALLNELESYINSPSNKYQPIPFNIGLQDDASSALINNYNQLVVQRNRLLQSASETSPSVTPITAQLDDIYRSIRSALRQTRRNMEIQRNALTSQLGKYEGQLYDSPEQERMLTQIGRQQEVKSGLYLMLLQKREENSISLASTADKGRLLDEPTVVGQISPNSKFILTTAALAGVIIPAAILFLLNFFRYKVEGHEDVESLTRLPIIADVAVASDEAKRKANIVVQENKNSTMEEIFRSMRTNLQFMMEEHQRVVMFTSSISGEGKTFNAANLAVSFALLGKRVVLVGLDIRKPRLAQLFEIEDHQHGITNLLLHDEPTWAQMQEQILPSGINNNLELLMAGPIPPNPAELVARHSLDVIFEQLREHYDYIIVDTAPVGLVTDTLQISRVVDLTVYVCRADYTPREYFGLINELSDEQKLPKVSIVINGIDMSKKKYGYYYGYGRYGRYGKYGRYGRYASKGGYYGNYGRYGHSYGTYNAGHYGDKNDNSIKK